MHLDQEQYFPFGEKKNKEKKKEREEKKKKKKKEKKISLYLKHLHYSPPLCPLPGWRNACTESRAPHTRYPPLPEPLRKMKQYS